MPVPKQRDARRSATAHASARSMVRVHSDSSEKIANQQHKKINARLVVLTTLAIVSTILFFALSFLFPGFMLAFAICGGISALVPAVRFAKISYSVYKLKKVGIHNGNRDKLGDKSRALRYFNHLVMVSLVAMAELSLMFAPTLAVIFVVSALVWFACFGIFGLIEQHNLSKIITNTMTAKDLSAKQKSLIITALLLMTLGVTLLMSFGFLSVSLFLAIAVFESMVFSGFFILLAVAGRRFIAQRQEDIEAASNQLKKALIFGPIAVFVVSLGFVFCEIFQIGTSSLFTGALGLGSLVTPLFLAAFALSFVIAVVAIVYVEPNKILCWGNEVVDENAVDEPENSNQKARRARTVVAEAKHKAVALVVSREPSTDKSLSSNSSSPPSSPDFDSGDDELEQKGGDKANESEAVEFSPEQLAFLYTLLNQMDVTVATDVLSILKLPVAAVVDAKTESKAADTDTKTDSFLNQHRAALAQASASSKLPLPARSVSHDAVAAAAAAAAVRKNSC